MSKSSTPSALEVFYSYSHRDQAFQVDLEDHLSVLKDEGYISTWSDLRIGAGDEWRKEIEAHLATADVVLLLVSASFLASRFCQAVELQRALVRHNRGEATVIPVIVRACDWKASLTGALQAVPRGGKPITHWRPRDSGYADAVQRIREKVEQIYSTKTHRAKRRTRITGGVQVKRAILQHVPRRNPAFTGRDNLLDEVRQALTSTERQPAIVALVGLPGVGKTALTGEYSYRFADQYDLVWWIRAEDTSSVAADLASLASYAGVLDIGSESPDRTGTAMLSGAAPAATAAAQRTTPDRSVAVRAALSWLDTASNWLLVFDNAESAAAIVDYIPQTGAGHVIITSRNQVWGGVAAPHNVDTLTLEEGVRFLVSRTGKRNPKDQEAASALVDQLGCLSLALEQAASFIEANGTSIQDYLQMVREATALNDPAAPLLTAVSATFNATLDRIGRESAAVALLRFCAWVSADDIPRELLTEAPDCLPPLLSKVVRSRVRFAELVGNLRRYSLLGVRGDALSTHRLIQRVVRDGLDDAACRDWCGRALQALALKVPDEPADRMCWPAYERYLVHVLTAAGHAERLRVESRMAAELLWRLGEYQTARARYIEARAVLEQALSLAQTQPVTPEPAVAPDLAARTSMIADIRTSLGNVLDSLGDVRGARSQYEASLTIGRQLGSDEIVATAVNNLGYLAERQHLYDEAIAYYVEALAIENRRRNESEAAKIMLNLGSVHLRLQRYDDARKYYEGALSIDESSVPPDKAEIAVDLAALGDLFLDINKFDDARNAFARALELDTDHYGGDHPAVAIDLTELGRAYLMMGDLEAAQERVERALTIQQKAFKTSANPERARTHFLQGRVLEAKGRLEDALSAFQEALNNDDNSDVEKVGDLVEIARLLWKLGQEHDATTRYQHAYRLCRSIRGLERERATISVALQSLGIEPGA